MNGLIYNVGGDGATWTTRLPEFVLWNGAMHETRVVVDAQDWQALADSYVYRTWTEPGDAWLGYAAWSVVSNPEPEDDIDVAARYLAGTVEERDAAHKQNLMAEIDNQVYTPTARQLVEDPTASRQVETTSGGASEQKSNLEDYTGDLDAFDPRIVPTPVDGAGFTEAKMTTFIDEIEPWAGAPDNNLALYCVLEIITFGAEAQGESARAHMFGPNDGPSGAVIPFAQDGVNPAIWKAESQIGRYWSDPEQSASMRLLWDSGSLPVAETKELQGQGDKQSAVVRAGLPETARGRGRP